MKNLSTILVIVVLCAVPAFGQNWTAEEKEVIEQIRTCWQSWIEAVKQNDFNIWKNACPAEDDFIQWDTSEGSPYTEGIEGPKQAIAENWSRLFGKTVRAEPRPLSIRIVNDIAMVYLYGNGIGENPEGKPVTWENKQLDIWQKMNGKWTYIGGMVHTVPKE